MKKDRIFIDGAPLECFKFPGGEWQVKVRPCSTCTIEAYLYSADDIILLLLVVDAIKRLGCLIRSLTIPYFPYARQDRICNFGESLSVKIMVDLINYLDLPSVMVYDPHSNVTPALLNKCRTISMADLLRGAPSLKILNENIILVAPDVGAEKKVAEYAKEINASMICATKTRNVQTGEITSTIVHDNVEGLDLLVMDDICDGGRTFIELAKVLKAKGAKELYLYVTHGIFSKGLKELSQYYKHIYCYHTFLDTVDISLLTVLGGIN